ncbi:putative reverse transcriptase domain-containing protein, partial [Tanacetum coccineum]
SSLLPILPPPLPASPTHSLGYRAAMIQLRAESPSTCHLLLLPPPIVLPHTRASMVMMRAIAPSTYILAPRLETPPSWTPPFLPIPLPTSSPPLLLPSTDSRADVHEVMLPPQKRLCIAPGPRYEIGESSSALTARPTRGFRADYGFVGTLDAEIRYGPYREIGYKITDDTYEIYRRLDDAHDDRSLMSGQLNLLRRDRRSHARTARLMKSKAKASREAWVQSMDASDTTCSEVNVLRTTVLAQQTKKMPLRKAPKTKTTRSSPATTTTTTTPVTDAQLKALIDQGVVDALAAHDVDRSQNGEDSHDSGTGGIEGVVKLTQWFKRMEIVFRISNYTVKNQIKFATCTLLGSALTWWNSHVKIVGHDVAYAMTLTNLKKKMTDKYCPRGEIKKLEVEMPIESYVGGLPDMIHGSVMAFRPKTMQDAIEFATELMDKKIHTLAKLQAENKRKFDNKEAQQQPPKKQGVAIAYTVGLGERKEYAGTLPLCNKCKFHHNGQCTVKYANCKKISHLTRDCRSYAATNNQRNLTCYECGNPGHYRSDCPEQKN